MLLFKLSWKAWKPKHGFHLKAVGEAASWMKKVNDKQDRLGHDDPRRRCGIRQAEAFFIVKECFIASATFDYKKNEARIIT